MSNNIKNADSEVSQRDVDARIESEREFHNKRFAHEVREPTHKFYQTVDGAFRQYEADKIKYATGKIVLEYGCGTGINAVKLAGVCKSIHGIDLSDVAIVQAIEMAKNAGHTNASFTAGNAEEMPFENEQFEFVFGSSILHHLDLKKAYAELHRVLKPGGIALFLEPLGHNPMINMYRSKTPDFRTPDEHPLLRSDIQLSLNYFKNAHVDLYGLATLGAIPLMKFGLTKPALLAGSMLDAVLLKLPVLKWWAWFSVIRLEK